ncbi:BON domain-containing protein [Burkholderia sp. Ac-20384]|uniref:BON domain-containing protein n=1 Tax=Burkholderia sp. Ac-20384 TaxID=2703902 RepID=UPI001980B6F1|nr:BON domain-containing protein [Burkholderia sp. Ac-20384]MBN3829608.1 BON domain-containing protein [Burkholderia sp. Ac-20384]
MKNTLTSILAITCLTFGINAQAERGAEAGYVPATVTDTTHVANPRKAQRAADRRLARTVRNALSATPHLVSSDITVVARHGVVTLIGQVDDQAQIQLAEASARQVAGVSSVTNNLNIAIETRN